MGYMSRDETTRLKALMRTMFFSAETIERFINSATAGQARALAGLIEDEAEVRERRKRERLMRKAKFPQIKSFNDYDFSEVALPEGYTVDALRSLEFMDAAQDFVFHGQTGRGKTHLAIAIGIAAVSKGREVRFFTAAELVMALTKAYGDNSLDRFMKDISKCGLLIVDELGYVPLAQAGARLLFQVLSDCYERRSLLITTNIEFSKWGVVFGDDKMASAIIDRVMHHGRLIEFNGSSKRMEHALMLGRVSI